MKETNTRDQQAQEYAEKKMCAALDLKPDCIIRQNRDKFSEKN